jgi:arsenate reductase (thioredoxin)
VKTEKQESPVDRFPAPPAIQNKKQVNLIMLVLGLQGSPRIDGNTNYLLSTFLEVAENLGARTQMVQVDKKNIVPCKEYTVCEKKGFCPINDDMKQEIYSLIREAEVIVAATPIFFYNMTAQLKALVDRCQTLWARKYRLKLNDPSKNQRKGFLLGVGATRGKNLFEGLELAIRYFFDAVDADYCGSLTYRGIEHSGDIKKHPSAKKDVEDATEKLLKSLIGRKKMLFTCENNACYSQMAAAFAQINCGDRLDVCSGGINPSDKLDPNMVKVMAEKNIDMKFRKPKSIEAAISGFIPDTVISFQPVVETSRVWDTFQNQQIWDMVHQTEHSTDSMRQLRDAIEKKVFELIKK